MPYRFVDPEQQRRYRFVESSAERFTAQQAAMGAPQAETQAELGGMHAPPPPVGSTAFNIVRGIADPMILSDPILSGAEILALGGAPGALRMGGVMARFGGVRGAEEAVQRGEDFKGIAKGAGKGALTGGIMGAALGPAIAPAATWTGAIIKPMAIMGGVGAVTAEPDKRLEGALQGAAMGLGMKGAIRGGEALMGGIARGGRAVKDLFGGAKGARDAPAGLVDEVFGLGATKPEYLGLPSPIGPAEESARVFEQAAAKEGALRQSQYGGQLLRADLAQQMPVESGALTFKPQSLGGLPGPPRPPLPTGPILDIKPPSIFVPEPPIRMGPPKVGALPRPIAGDEMELVKVIGQKFAAEAPTVAERETLRNLAVDTQLPNEVRQAARQALRRFPEAVEAPSIEPIQPPEPPGAPLPTVPPITPRGPKGPMPDEEVAFSTFMKRELKRHGRFNPDQWATSLKDRLPPAVYARYFSPKSSRSLDTFINDDIVSRGFAKDANDFIEAMGNPKGRRALVSQTGAPRVGVKEAERLAAVDAESQLISDINASKSVGDLSVLLNELKDPNSAPAKAAYAKIKELGGSVDLPNVIHVSQIQDDTLKGLLKTNLGARQTYTKEEVQAAEVWAKQIRPNPDPLDDLNGARDALLSTSGIDPTTVGPRGGVGGPGGTGNNSLSEDMGSWVNRVGNTLTSAGKVEVAQSMGWLNRITHSAQELARQFPVFKPVYEAFHQWPARATDNFNQWLTRHSFYEKPGMTPYMKLPEDKLKAINQLGMQHKVNRQGQPRMTHEQMRQARGFTEEMSSAFDDVMNSGKGLLDSIQSWYIDSRLPKLVAAGHTEAEALGILQARAAQARQGLDHWVPSYRSGDKLTMVTHPDSQKPLAYEFWPNIHQRAKRAAELKQLYPESRGYKVTEDVVDNFVKSKGFDEIDLGSLELLSRYAQVDPEIADQFIKQITPAILQKSETLAHFKKFENIPGAKEDLREGLLQTARGVFSYIERNKAKMGASDALGKIDQREQKELYRFAEKYIDDNMAPGDKRMAKIRDWTYAYTMGAVPKQWALQMTQYPTVVVPSLMKYGSISEAASAANTGMKWALSRNYDNAPANLKDLWRQGFREGSLQPRAELYTGEALGEMAAQTGMGKDPMSFIPEHRLALEVGKTLREFEAPSSAAMKNLRNWSMVFVTDADMRTRFGAMTAFYEMGRKRGMDHIAAKRFGIDEANRTNFLYGPAESPHLFGRQGAAIFLNMFKSWPTQYTSLMRGLLREANQELPRELQRPGLLGQLGPKQIAGMAKSAFEGPSSARALGASMASMAALGGVLYQIPGPLQVLLKQGLGIDPEESMRNFLSGTLELPEMATNVALRGVGTLAGVDMSRSLSLGDTIPTALADLLGPTPAMISSIGKGAGQLYKAGTQDFGPDPLDAMERAMGGGLKNVMKASRLMNEGIATRRGGLLPGSEQLRAVDPYLQLMGLTPLAVSEAQTAQRKAQEAVQERTDRQSNVYEKLSAAIIRKDNEAITAIRERIQRANEQAIKEGRPDKLITINNSQLRQHVAEKLSPGAAIKRAPKAMRQRLLELQETYLGPPEPPAQ